MEEDGLLPVEWNGRILCRVTESGAVRYDPTWVDTSRAKAALAQVTEAAGTVMEYMTLLENAPPLKADGLADGYRVLAEFNGTVLAGTETRLGAQFVTWARDYDRSGVNNGHYYMEDYQAPGRTSPSAPAWWPGNGSLTRSRWRGCARRCRASSMERAPPPTSRSSNAGASWIRSQPSCRKEPRIRCRAKSEAWTVHMRAVPNQAPLFLYRNCWYRLVCGIFSLRMVIALSRKSGIVVVRSPPKNNEEDTRMKQIEKHPAPEKLLQQITEEAINALALGGPDKIGDEAPMEQA